MSKGNEERENENGTLNDLISFKPSKWKFSNFIFFNYLCYTKCKMEAAAVEQYSWRLFYLVRVIGIEVGGLYERYVVRDIHSWLIGLTERKIQGSLE